METENKKTVGVAITGSFCTHEKIKETLWDLKAHGWRVIPVFSENAAKLDTRFGKAADFVAEAQKITGEHGIFTIPEAEPAGPKKLFDVLIIVPCTGNTLAKLSLGITDTPVLMAAKAHLRNERPLVVALSTNDAMGMNFKNIGALYNVKHIYFVPFGQDDPAKKPNSLISDVGRIPDTIEAACAGRQLQPVLLR